jgi:thiosulfate reductase cytochrome b subunit
LRVDDKDATHSASASDPDYALDRRDLDYLHDAERLGDLQRVTQPAIHVAWWMTLGGWLAGGIAWHISIMWVLLADGAAYLFYGFLSGHFRRDFYAIGPRAVIGTVVTAVTGRLGHSLGHYNAVQRLLYVGVIALICC